MSRPTRARGLKPNVNALASTAALVAPHAGAWIETANHGELLAQHEVAPHAGAWIETTA